MVFPWIPFLFPRPGEDDELSKYVLQASFDGRLKSDEGFLSAAGDLVTLTAASGKDLYLTAAEVSFFNNTANNVGTPSEVTLNINTVIKETAKATFQGLSSTASGKGAGTSVYEFKNIGQKVAATQIMKLEVIGIVSDVDVEGFIQAIEVPTGENPTIYQGA